METNTEVKILRRTVMENLSKTMNHIFTNDFSGKSIKCPKYLLGLDNPDDITECFGLEIEPETLIPPLSLSFDKFSATDMQWRMDIGIWSTTRNEKNNDQSFAVSLLAPGLSSEARDDSSVKSFKTIVVYYIPSEAKK